jgi:hypothetical protein
VNGGGLVVGRGSCLFVCYHVCIIVSPSVRNGPGRAGPDVFRPGLRALYQAWPAARSLDGPVGRVIGCDSRPRVAHTH